MVKKSKNIELIKNVSTIEGGEKRAEYGKELLQQLSVDLTSRFGRGFSVDNLETMRLFYQTYIEAKVSQKYRIALPDEKVLAVFKIQWSKD